MIVFPPAWVAAVTAGTKRLGAVHLKIEDLISMVLWFVGPEALSGNLVPCENVFFAAVVI